MNSLATELYRKSLHFLLILIPIFFCYLGKWKTLLLIAPITAVIVLLDYMRRDNQQIQQLFIRFLGSILRPHEIDGKKLCGASSIMLAACINFLLFEKTIAVTSFLIVVISDALAAIFLKAVPSEKFFEKTRASVAAFGISALIILITCGLIFHTHFWFYLFGIFSVFCVTIIEARPSLFDVDDNLSIPLVFSFLMVGFGFMWG